MRDDRALAYWPTPDEVAEDLIYLLMGPWLGQGQGIRVLEPSAGAGHLIRAVRRFLPEAHITAVEPSPERCDVLRGLTNTRPAATARCAGRPEHHPVVDEVIEGTLEDYLASVAVQALTSPWTPFDVVAMNPPFALDGHPEAWAEHVLAIHNDPHLLRGGGVLGAVVPHTVLTGKSKRVRAIRDLKPYAMEVCPRGAFSSTGAKVSTAMVWIEK